MYAKLQKLLKLLNQPLSFTFQAAFHIFAYFKAISLSIFRINEFSLKCSQKFLEAITDHRSLD